MPVETITTTEKIQIMAGRKGMTMPQVAAKIGLTPAALQYRVRNEAWNLKTLEKVAAALEITIQDLI